MEFNSGRYWPYEPVTNYFCWIRDLLKSSLFEFQYYYGSVTQFNLTIWNSSNSYNVSTIPMPICALYWPFISLAVCISLDSILSCHVRSAIITCSIFVDVVPYLFLGCLKLNIRMAHALWHGILGKITSLLLWLLLLNIHNRNFHNAVATLIVNIGFECFQYIVGGLYQNSPSPKRPRPKRPPKF